MRTAPWCRPPFDEWSGDFSQGSLLIFANLRWAGSREENHLIARLGSFSMSDLVSARSARARAMQVQAREIEAHRRAINLQESSAIMFDRVHQTAKSHNARQRADHAREKLRQALAELNHFEKQV